MGTFYFTTKVERRRTMAAKNSHATAPAEQELVITRIFDAPRELFLSSVIFY
jgi:hypothetical protein